MGTGTRLSQQGSTKSRSNVFYDNVDQNSYFFRGLSFLLEIPQQKCCLLPSVIEKNGKKPWYKPAISFAEHAPQGWSPLSCTLLSWLQDGCAGHPIVLVPLIEGPTGSYHGSSLPACLGLPLAGSPDPHAARAQPNLFLPQCYHMAKVQSGPRSSLSPKYRFSQRGWRGCFDLNLGVRSLHSVITAL